MKTDITNLIKEFKKNYSSNSKVRAQLRIVVDVLYRKNIFTVEDVEEMGPEKLKDLVGMGVYRVNLLYEALGKKDRLQYVTVPNPKTAFVKKLIVTKNE